MNSTLLSLAIYFVPFLLILTIGLFYERALPFRSYAPLVLVLLLIVFGLRDNIGPDWDLILETYELVPRVYNDVLSALQSRESLYVISSLLSHYIGTGIYGVNIICFTILCLGIYTFLSTLKRPWLALATYYPYYILIVSVNYNRQSAALGLVLCSLAKLADDKLLSALILVFLAIQFHPSASLMLVVPFVYLLKRRPLLSCMLIPLLVLLIPFFVSSALDAYSYNYFYSGIVYTSYGFWPRILPLLVSSCVFVYYRPIISRSVNYSWIYSVISCLVFLSSTIGLFVPNTSTVLDRISIYLSPILLFAASDIIPSHAILFRHQKIRVAIVALYSFSFIILFASCSFYFSYYWIPYRNVLG